MATKKPDGIKGSTEIVKENPGKAYRNFLIIMTGLIILAGLVYLAGPSNKAVAGEVTVYKSATCGCCSKWVQHLRDAGFKVSAINSENLASLKEAAGILPGMGSCHTAFVDGYVIEGHVPAADIERLLREKPDITGLSAPGMPPGSPGMDGSINQPYNVLAFDKDGRTTVYASH